MVRQWNEIKKKLFLKLLEFDCKVPFKVSTKSGTKMSVILLERWLMKWSQEAFSAQKALFSVLASSTTHFEWILNKI